MQYCQEEGRHCHPFPEQNHNVFNRSDNDDAVVSVKRSSCTSDAAGAFGSASNINNATTVFQRAAVNDFFLVEFQYQVQTSLSQTVPSLLSNASALLSIEKAVSDLLVATFFEGCNDATTAASAEHTGAWQRRRDHVRLQQSQESSDDGLTGLTAAPADRILPGLAGGT